MHLVKKSFSFCFQVTTRLLINSSNKNRSTSIGTMLIYFRISPRLLVINGMILEKLNLVEQAKRILNIALWLFLVDSTVNIDYIIEFYYSIYTFVLIYIVNNLHRKRTRSLIMFIRDNILHFASFTKSEGICTGNLIFGMMKVRR